MEEAVSMEVMPNDNMVLNTTESGLVLATVEVESYNKGDFVVALEAAARPFNYQTGKRWGTINVAEGLSIPYTGCAGGKTRQKDDEFWNRLFPKDNGGFAKVDPRGTYTLKDGSPFETGREAALREFDEETLGVWREWMTADPVMKEFRTAGGFTGEWKDEKTGQVMEFRSSVTVLHVHIVLPTPDALIGVMKAFEQSCLTFLTTAEALSHSVTREDVYHETRPEYRRMHFIRKEEYWYALHAAAEHLKQHKLGTRPTDGCAQWIDTWPDMGSLIAIRKWDLYILMRALLENKTTDVIGGKKSKDPLYSYFRQVLKFRSMGLRH